MALVRERTIPTERPPPVAEVSANTFVNKLDDEELSVGYLQQDGATFHTSHANMAEIQSFFGDHLIIIKLLKKCPVYYELRINVFSNIT